MGDLAKWVSKKYVSKSEKSQALHTHLQLYIDLMGSLDRMSTTIPFGSSSIDLFFDCPCSSSMDSFSMPDTFSDIPVLVSMVKTPRDQLRW